MEFYIAPGQDASIPVHFRPKSAGRYLAILEVRVSHIQGGNQFPGIHQPANQEQVHTINLIGSAVAPKIKIGDGSGELEISMGRSKLPISNLSNFDLPLIVEIDQEFLISIDNEETNRIVIPKQSTVMAVISPTAHLKQAGKLKVYFDGKEKTIVDWCQAEFRKILKLDPRI